MAAGRRWSRKLKKRKGYQICFLSRRISEYSQAHSDFSLDILGRAVTTTAAAVQSFPALAQPLATLRRQLQSNGVCKVVAQGCEILKSNFGTALVSKFQTCNTCMRKNAVSLATGGPHPLFWDLVRFLVCCVLSPVPCMFGIEHFAFFAHMFCTCFVRFVVASG